MERSMKRTMAHSMEHSMEQTDLLVPPPHHHRPHLHALDALGTAVALGFRVQGLGLGVRA